MMYRERLYKSYVYGRSKSLVDETLDGLQARAPYLNHLITSHFPQDKNATIVDLGCGHGALIYFAKKKGYRNIIGFDCSPEQVVAANRLGIEGVQEGDVQESLKSFSDLSLDVIVTFDVIEHLSKVELFDLVDEVYRALRPGGCWIIHVPNAESPFFGRIRYGDLTHELAFTQESIAQLLMTTGFSKITCYEDAPIPHGLKSAVRWALWKILRSFLQAYLSIETGHCGRNTILTQNLLAVVNK